MLEEAIPAETRLESRRPLPGSHPLPVLARIPGGTWKPGNTELRGPSRFKGAVGGGDGGGTGTLAMRLDFCEGNNS